MNMLNLYNQRPAIRKELSRRIGYTNGLHGIFRFARVVSYLQAIAPASASALRGSILENEKQNVRGAKYADGVVDVARALDLVDRTGSNLVPSDKGYALHAVQQLDSTANSSTALLLNAVMETDGDATLNLLDLLALGAEPDSLGHLLVDRLLSVLDQREQWAEECIRSKAAKDFVRQELGESRSRLNQAVDPGRKVVQPWSTQGKPPKLNPEQKVQRFLDHTVNPRRGWLRELGCVEQRGRSDYAVTERGSRLLNFLKSESCYSEEQIVLPFSSSVQSLLADQGQALRADLFWRATASVFRDHVSASHISGDQQLDQIAAIYPHVKLSLFNEATIGSIYCAASAQHAVNGQYLPWQSFPDQLDAICNEFPERIYRLRQRHGGSGYITLRSYAR